MRPRNYRRPVHRPWWRPDEETERNPNEFALRLHSWMTAIQQRQNGRRSLDLLHAALYSENAIASFAPGNYARNIAEATERLSLNVIQSVCDAATSKLVKTKPKPTFLTDGGDYFQRLKAEDLESFIEGKFYELDAYETGERCALDCCVFGTGLAKTYIDGDEICIERTPPWEMVVDESEAQEPKRMQNMAQWRFVDRWVLIEQVKAWEAEGLCPTPQDGIAVSDRLVDYTPQKDTIEQVARDPNADLLKVQEAWHLPSSEDADDGLHIITVPDFVLMREPWTRRKFPFAVLRWTKPVQGFFGRGLAETLTGIQVEINNLLIHIQEAMSFIRGHWMVERGSEVLLSHINNDLQAILEYSGTPPQYYAPVRISDEVYQHLVRLYQWAFEISGINQLAAQSQKPAGLNSGKALQTYDDMQTERFVTVMRNYENFYLDIADHVIDLAKDLAARDGEYKAKGIRRDGIQFLKWSDVDMKRDEFVMKVQATNAFSNTPSAKLQQVTDAMSAGIITDPADAADLLDFADLKKFSDRLQASRRNVESALAKMVRTGEYESPEPEMQLQQALRIATEAYLDYRLKAVPEDRLELVRQYMAALKQMMAPPAPPAPPPGAAQIPPGAPPPGANPPPSPAGPVPGGPIPQAA